VQLTISGLDKGKRIEDVVVRDDIDHQWELQGEGWPVAVEGDPPSVQVFIATQHPSWPTLLLSCHDMGWEGFPLDQNPYVAQGSRALFGYSFLFTPMIPIFFSGEEFNATFRPIPWESPHLYGGQDAGKGRWLYGAMLDWDELNNPEHHAMFEDVKKMIAVRKQEADVLALTLEKEEPKLMAVSCERDITVPVPYIRWDHRSAILVAANPNTNEDAQLKLRIPLKEIGLAGRTSYKVTSLWPGGETKTYPEKDLAGFACTVKRDRTQGGGLLVLKIEPSI
jgi:hypothetical protein